MQLKYMKTLLPQQDGAAKIAAIAWAPNNQKLAVCNAERVIVMYDGNGEKKDKFATKPVEAKYGKKSYVVRGIAFSPDSTKIAVGQSDNIIFVYKIGDSWADKKVICNKFPQSSAVTCLIWPSEQGIVCGCADGKVRLANVKTNKSSTLFGTNNFVVALAASPNSKAFLSGHADGSIVKYFFDGETAGEPQGKICTHSCAPYCLLWTPNSIVAAGCDKRVIAYNKVDGKVQQQFDYSRDDDEREFSCAVQSPSGQSLVIGSYDRFRVFIWNNRRLAWEEGKMKEIKYLYTITALAWKYDGSRVVAGTLCGSVEMFDCCLKRSTLKNKFEVTFVGPTQAIIKDIQGGNTVVVKSDFGSDIEDVKVLGKDRCVVATTADTLLFGDMLTGKTSEIPWKSSGNEKYYFECENVAMIFNAGELSLVEYGTNDILGSVRTEFMNPHLLSVRLNERKHKALEHIKRMAYLIDVKTICILDLFFGSTIATIAHDSKIDWLELNETGRRLLYRDKRLRLHLYNIESETKTMMLNYCVYIQWVPGSDVAVGQSRDNLCIWYNIDQPDRVTTYPVKGDVQQLVRADGKSEVIIHEGLQEVIYTLDEGLIEFGTAMEDTDFARAIEYLEKLDINPQTEGMWRQLARTALEQKQLHVAERCYAALGEVAKARYLNETIKMAKDSAKQTGGDGTQYYKVRARMAIMDKRFKDAEGVYLEQNALDEALEMYQEMHKWDEALELAQARGHPDIEDLKLKFYRHLAETGQDEKAGEMRNKEGDHMGAIDLYLKANLPGRASKIVCEHQELLSNSEFVQSIAVALIKAELLEQAGELFEKTGDFERALECYKRGKAFNKAIELARAQFPQAVTKLEEEWGDHLMSQKQTMASINHFIESGNTLKALDAAVRARQWSRAAEIVEVLDNPEMAKEYYGKIAEHYASVQEFERAERFFIEAGMPKEAIQMYNSAGKWQDAHRLGSEFLQEDESSAMHLEQANTLKDQGKCREAEKLYLIVHKPELAIAMYKAAQEYDSMMRLIEQFFPDKAEDAQLKLAEELKDLGRMHEAEQYYVAAKDWKAAVSMYCTAELWEDAHRVAKQHGGDVAPKLVAFLWSKSLGGDSAVKLLQKFGLLEEAIEHSTENGNFEFAFELCRLGMKTKMPQVHAKYAAQLEEEGQYEQAETHFLQGNKPEEAVKMYIQQQDWDAAQRVAEKHAPDAIADVYVGQARLCFERQDFAKGESFLLRAHKPELIVQSYKERGMWNDAIRICKDYLPNLLPKVQDEYDQFALRSGAKGVHSFIAQAKEWEEQGEYDRAIEAFLKVTPELADLEMVERSLSKAGDIAVKFLEPRKAKAVVEHIGPKLQDIKKFAEAAELYLSVELVREAVNCLMAAGDWKKAKKIATEMEPDLEPIVDEKYKEFLKSGGNVDDLVGVDVKSAIEMFIGRGQWDKALATAEQQKNKPLLEKYVALYATELIKQNAWADAVRVFVKYGSPANAQNFNIYKKLIDEIVGMRGLYAPEAYETWSALRDMLLLLSASLHSTMEAFDKRYMDIFDRYLTVAHYYAERSAFMQATATDPQIQLYATKLSISLLRHSDLIPADKAFYEAGMACRKQGGNYESMAFVYLNHYLDLAEAIEENNPDAVEYDDFQGTDIPTEISLPESLHLSATDHEEVKEWVLAVSVDKQIDRVLLTDKRGAYEASLIGPDGSTSEPCVVTGYPVLDDPVKLGNDKVAYRDDWNKLQMATKMSKIEATQDVVRFIQQWTGSSGAIVFS